MGDTETEARSTTTRRGSGQVLRATVAGGASLVAVVSVGLMLVNDDLASSAWPLVLAIAAMVVAALALWAWWRGDDTGTATPDRDQPGR